MQDLPSWLEARGLALPDGFLPIAIYVSNDGKVLAGEAVFIKPDAPAPYYSFPWRVTLED
jgi:hypothetical protein